jgi:hypothetical protein
VTEGGLRNTYLCKVHRRSSSLRRLTLNMSGRLLRLQSRGGRSSSSSLGSISGIKDQAGADLDLAASQRPICSDIPAVILQFDLHESKKAQGVCPDAPERSGRSLEDPWKVPGGSLEGPWKVPGRSLEGPWKVPGRSLEGPWKVPGRSLEGPWKASGRSMEGPWKVHGRPLEGPWKAPGKSLEGAQKVPSRSPWAISHHRRFN